MPAPLTPDAVSFLQGERGAEKLAVEIGRDRHGAFGGAFGGLVAASVVVALRQTPVGAASLDARFLRGLAVVPTDVVDGPRMS